MSRKAIMGINIICGLLVFFALFAPWLTKIISEQKAIKYGYGEVEMYSKYFASVGSWISGITVPIFTFVSVLLLFTTLQIQKKEFKNTREALSRQQFDSTFFNMINLHNNIVDNILYEDSKSRDALEKLWKSFNERVEGYLRTLYTIKQKGEPVISPELEDFMSTYEDEEYMESMFDDFLQNNNPSLGHYFRNMYRIIKIIQSSSLSESEKQEYRGIFRAQLSSAELYLLFYNVVYSTNGEQFFEVLKGTDFFEGHVRELLKEKAILSLLNNRKYDNLNE
ncbi:putative phage abortive infection protein [Halobacillus sp. A1]|uniref:putative phage abortive infection protein n=1 Tax=Halobacillus sp. A1 TaxID=2880262 RepID=UPI0020A6362A|nr:putative phage abortive infection protein [Halobacillus sp. A1]MCP3032633.1 putative phage abortive infection protein [Halobacillus sp. A1]